ncbi:DNA polymerase I [Marinibaculum pumilum]|uniref:DNA polymerase I n=1 Tax=Marinibaculum pumilum TaxID=1766165 RepID=A0ABV7L101_9PROT
MADNATLSPAAQRDGATRHRLYLVDGSGYIFRAYHALPPLTRKSDGAPVGAVSGFCNMLNKLLEDAAADGRVSHIAVIFDAARATFRNDIYPDYKANRDEPPEDLVPQFAMIREACGAFSLPAIEMEGFEADDLIATFAKRARAEGADVVIVSSDKDLMQLVGDGVWLLDPLKNRELREKEVLEKFGVAPDRVVDVQSLAGDSTDNVPGVPGIGIKTAAQLIGEYGDLDALLERAAEIKQPKRRENLIQFAEQARISRELVRLRDDVPVTERLDDFAIRRVDETKLIGFLDEMEFRTLKARVIKAHGLEAAQPEEVVGRGVVQGDGHGEPLSAQAPAVAKTDYRLVQDMAALQDWIDRATSAGRVAVDTETTDLSPRRARLCGVSLAVEPGEACYIPLGHVSAGDLADDPTPPKQIPEAEALAALKPLLEDPAVLKVGQNIKYDMVMFLKAGIRVAPIDDTMLLSYTADPGHGHGMDELSELHLGHRPIPYAEVCGKGKAQITFDRVALDAACAYAAEDADITLRLHHVLRPMLLRSRRVALYETLDRPLATVIADMEFAGIKVDPAALQRLSADFAERMTALEAEIQELAGERFNVGSPKQLGEILFEKMSLPGGRKGKNGAWGTGADVLERLSAEGHDLPRRVLDWRQLAKLKSTYTDTLQAEINAETGRVHTSFALAATSTGRLSSSEPNLQNIPVRTEEGRKIRAAFVAEPGHKLVSADYSQIELRILADIADIPQLKQAFHDGIDIHALTASEVFGVPIEGMDPMVRRSAKAINFGIIYGISAFGLANNLGIPQGEAKRFIDAYFERYPGVKTYMDAKRREAHEQGFVTTLWGRRCVLPGINSKNPAERAFNERAAINAPIQGTAADIIKRAMVALPPAIAEAGLAARMLLQVHDELLFEVPEGEVDRTKTLVAKVMQGAADLSVPLEVEAGAGDSWGQAH